MPPSPLSRGLGGREVLCVESPQPSSFTRDLGWSEFCWESVGSTIVQSCELRGMGRRVLEFGCYCLVLESLRQNWCSVVVGLH